jgi:hypothetical protein
MRNPSRREGFEGVAREASRSRRRPTPGGGAEHPHPVFSGLLPEKERAGVGAPRTRAGQEGDADRTLGAQSTQAARWARLEAISAVSEDAYNTALRLELRDGLAPLPAMAGGRVHR